MDLETLTTPLIVVTAVDSDRFCFHPYCMTQFNPAAPLDSEAQGYCKSPGLKDQIHCVAYVIDSCKISIMSSKLEAKLDAIRRKVNLMGQYK